MNFNFLLTITILFHLQCISQCPPPGSSTFYSLDFNNDGYTQFDINNYIQFILRPNLETYYNTNTLGYTTTFFNSNNTATNSPYTNITLNEVCYFKIEYSGSGDVFPEKPCEDKYVKYRSIQLIAIPFDGDEDNDGISNKNEDSNNNLNLMDDDDDNDGIINLFDPTSLSNKNYDKLQAKIFPNPVTNGLITIESNSALDEIIIYDYSGKIVLNQKVNMNSINLNSFSKGVYIVKLKKGTQLQTNKILIN